MGDAKSAVATILLLKHTRNGFYVTINPVVLKIFVNVFAFLYVEASSKKICEKRSLPSFSEKILMSAFLLRFKANYLEKKKNTWLPPFFFVDSNSPCIHLLFQRGPNLVQKLLYLVGTVF